MLRDRREGHPARVALPARPRAGRSHWTSANWHNGEMGLSGNEILIVALVIALVFGAAKLPKLARSIGQAKGEFEKGMKEGAEKPTGTADDDA